MTKKQSISKDQPEIETVQEGFKLSDYLTIDVCEPVKTQVDQIEVCCPNLEKTGSRSFRGISGAQGSRQASSSTGYSRATWYPIGFPTCYPRLYPCTPYAQCYPNNCVPSYYEGPWTNAPIMPAPDAYGVESERLTFEMETLVQEIKTIRTEIAALKMKIQ